MYIFFIIPFPIQVLKRGYESKLLIEDTTYDHQGDYVCEAINIIAGQRKIVQSEPVHIEVRGMYNKGKVSLK